jgi:uncharacterized membrane protein
MPAKAYPFLFALFALSRTVACGVAGPLGFGPALDPIIGPLLFVFLLIGEFLAVKSVSDSPTVQAISKRISMAGSDLQKSYAEHSAASVQPRANPEEILRERYARGEIDRKQYLEMLEDLRKK